MRIWIVLTLKKNQKICNKCIIAKGLMLSLSERKRMIELKSTTIKPELNDSQQDIIGKLDIGNCVIT